MAIPLLAAVPAGISKLGAALAALKGGGAAVKGAGFLKSMAPLATKTKAAVSGMPGTATKLVGGMPGVGKTRMAMDAVKSAAEENIKKLGIKEMRDAVRHKGLNMADDAGMFARLKRGLLSTEGFKKNLGMPMTKDDIMMAVAPDLLFGGLTALTTEGDIVDKAIAGIGSTAGGVAGGIGGRGLLGPKSGLGILGTEMVGGIVGDQIGQDISNSIIRAKHGGMTPAEQSYAQQGEAYKQAIIDEFLRENGLG